MAELLWIALWANTSKADSIRAQIWQLKAEVLGFSTTQGLVGAESLGKMRRGRFTSLLLKAGEENLEEFYFSGMTPFYCFSC